MSDNVTIPAQGTGTSQPVISTDDVGGVQYQRVKVDLGGDGLASPLLRGQQTMANSLPVALASNQDVIAKESGGNLDTIAASLSVVDDWDESDRAKVNVIVGQAGIAGGTGTDGATVPRVTLATNVALPAGTNAIGKLAANSGVDIGDVDVTSVTPGVAATSLGKAEDAAHSSGDVGVMILGVRQDSQSDFAADGDYVPLSINADGEVRVAFAGASGGTSAADDADFTATSTAGTPVMGVFESSPTSVTDGDMGIVGITAARRLKTSATVDAALPAGNNNIGDVDVASIAAGNNNIGDVDVASIAAGDNNIGNVDIVTMPNVTLAAGTGTQEVVGDVADDAAAAGNPVRVGGFAISPDGTDPGSVSAEADAASFRTDLNRRLLVSHYHPRTLTKHLDGSTAYTDESIIADPGDNFQAVITNIIGSTGNATAMNFFLEEGSTKIFGPIYLEAVAGRGFCSGPIYLPCTASTAVTLTSSASIAQSFQIEYFIQAV